MDSMHQGLAVNFGAFQQNLACLHSSLCCDLAASEVLDKKLCSLDKGHPNHDPTGLNRLAMSCRHDNERFYLVLSLSAAML